MDTLFAVTAPGLEGLAAEELIKIGLIRRNALKRAVVEGGVTFHGGLQAVYRANLLLRTASRVVVRLGEFHAAGFPELRKKASRLSWEKFISAGQTISLSVTCRKSRLYHSGAVAERISAAISDHLGYPINVSNTSEPEQDTFPTQMVIARLFYNHVTISIDSSGGLLHRRGYRLATAKAPLRETLAAAMILASGWNTTSPLIDPFCGSGTIAIEAALLSADRPPGLAASQKGRAYAFTNWPEFDPALWEKVQSDLIAQPIRISPLIQASDRDAGAIRIARANAERAGVLDRIDFSQRAISAIEPPPGSGWVITNPPYGQRVSSNKDLRNLYAQFGNVLRAKCSGWNAAVLCNDLKLIGQMGFTLDTSFSTVNGGISVLLGRGKIS